MFSTAVPVKEALVACSYCAAATDTLRAALDCGKDQRAKSHLPLLEAS